VDQGLRFLGVFDAARSVQVSRDGYGSLTIVLPKEGDSAPFAVLKCGRCGSPRGTLQALREMSSLGARHLETHMRDTMGLR
jgi:hypothetical protein